MFFGQYSDHHPKSRRWCLTVWIFRNRTLKRRLALSYISSITTGVDHLQATRAISQARRKDICHCVIGDAVQEKASSASSAQPESYTWACQWAASQDGCAQDETGWTRGSGRSTRCIVQGIATSDRTSTTWSFLSFPVNKTHPTCAQGTKPDHGFFDMPRSYGQATILEQAQMSMIYEDSTVLHNDC